MTALITLLLGMPLRRIIFPIIRLLIQNNEAIDTVDSARQLTVYSRGPAAPEDLICLAKLNHGGTKLPPEWSHVPRSTKVDKNRPIRHQLSFSII